MIQQIKIWLIIAGCLIILGSILFAITMAGLQWDFTRLSTTVYVTNTHSIAEPFNDISIKVDSADIILIPAQNHETEITCYEYDKEHHTVAVENGVLTIEPVNQRKWYDHIGIDFHSPKITLCLPAQAYASLVVSGSTGDISIPADYAFETMDIKLSTGDVSNAASTSGCLSIKTNTGGIRVSNAVAAAMELHATTGRIQINDVTCSKDINASVTTGKIVTKNVHCSSFISNGTTGDIELSDVIAEKAFLIDRDTGDVEFDRCDAAEICVNTSTGDVEGNLLTDKVFITQSSTGEIDVPKSDSGGKCEISTSTGDIDIDIHP